MDHTLSPATPDLEALVAQRTQELQKALDRAQSLYDHAPCGYLSLDENLRFVNINQTLLNWLGYTREELIEHHDLFDLVDPALRDHIDLRIHALRQGEQTEGLELAVRRKDGSQFHVLSTSTGVFDEDGRFLHSNTTVVDISDRKAAERRLSVHESFLETITNRIPAQLAYYDKDLICRFVNRAYAHGNGKQPQVMLGEPLASVVPPDLLPDILPHVADALNGQPQTFEVERAGPGEERSYYEIHYIPDARDGAVEGIFLELHDITERKRTEEFVLEANRDLEERVRERTSELFLSEQRYRLMVDAVQDYCVYFVDENGTIAEWSESAQRLHGHRRQQIVGKPYRVLLATHNSGEDEIDPDQALRLAKAHGQWETRGWRLRDDGSRFWAHTVLTALRNEAGELQGLSSITRDMTAAKSLEDVMNDLNKELEKRVAERTQQLVAANKDLDVFSHMVSHDLRAPLRHISSFVALLQEHLAEQPDAVTQQYLGSIVKASKRMGLMIEGLLEYARLGRVAIESQPVPLNPLVEGVIGHLRQEHASRQIEWVVEEDLPVVRGDAMLLAEVFTNLLENSVKFTRTHDTARIEVGWSVNPVGGRTFFVRDDGVGFDLEKAHNLFVMFQRQHHSMDFEGQGTGLALSQRIIERHGGRVWAETSPGQGCTFYFTLPFDGVDTEAQLEFPQSAMADLAL